MTRHIVDLDAPDRFVAGAVGEAEGCYLVAARGRRTVSVTLEQEQLALVAHGTLVLIGELEQRGLIALEIGDPTAEPQAAGAAGPGAAYPGTTEPAAAARPRRHLFDAGLLSVAWDDDGERIIVEARSMHDDAGAGESAPPPDAEPDPEELTDDDPLGPDVLRVRLTPLMAQRFARQAARVAASAAGVCPVCRQALGARPHRCGPVHDDPSGRPPA